MDKKRKNVEYDRKENVLTQITFLLYDKIYPYIRLMNQIVTKW